MSALVVGILVGVLGMLLPLVLTWLRLSQWRDEAQKWQRYGVAMDEATKRLFGGHSPGTPWKGP